MKGAYHESDYYSCFAGCSCRCSDGGRTGPTRDSGTGWAYAQGFTLSYNLSCASTSIGGVAVRLGEPSVRATAASERRAVGLRTGVLQAG